MEITIQTVSTQSGPCHNRPQLKACKPGAHKSAIACHPNMDMCNLGVKDIFYFLKYKLLIGK